MACICKSLMTYIWQIIVCVLGYKRYFMSWLKLLFKITKMSDALYSKWLKQTEKCSGYADTNNYK